MVQLANQNSNAIKEGKIVKFKKKQPKIGVSTLTWCLKDREEIFMLYKQFELEVDNARSLRENKIALRNLTMFVCAINIGLRGGDFCRLKWSDIYNEDWTFRTEKTTDFVPEKTQKYHKHITLKWSKDFEIALTEWLEWNNNYVKKQNYDDYIFMSATKDNHIERETWGRIMERTRKKAGVQQRIATHGLRKTMANQYIKQSDNPSEALMEVSTMFGHGSLKTTEIYACIADESIQNNMNNLAFLYDM